MQGMWTASPTNRRLLKHAGYAAGVGLIAGAIYLAAGEVDWAVLANTSPTMIVAFVILIAVNLLVAASIFQVVTRSFDADPPVPDVVMLALIASSALLNYLPMRPGLITRAAYLKWRHRLPIVQSVQILAAVMVLGISVSLASCLFLLPLSWPVQAAMAAAMLILLTVATGPLARRCFSRAMVQPWLWVPLRCLDLAAHGARMWMAFEIVGHPIPWHLALLAAAAGSVVAMVGLTPNGLGLKEWAIAGLVMLLAPVQGAAGLAASLVDRAIEAGVTVAAGVPATIAVSALHVRAGSDLQDSLVDRD